MTIRNYRLWTWEWAVLLLLMAILIYAIFISSGRENKTIDNSAAKVDSIRIIKKALAEAGVTLKECADLTLKQQREYDSLKAECDKNTAIMYRPVPKRTIKYTPPLLPVKAQAPQRVIIEIQDNRTPQTFQATIQAPTVSKTTVQSQPDATYLTEQSSVEKSNFTLEKIEHKFCGKIGDQYWPHLGVMDGEKYPELVSNGIGGYDLFLMPSGTLATIVPTKYFITEDGWAGVPISMWAKYKKLPKKLINASGVFVEVATQDVNGVTCYLIKYI